MAKVYGFEGVIPVVDPRAFVHPDAVLIGDVIIAAHCYIGPGACLRGDFGRIRIEAGANVQDNCVLHSFPGAEMWVGPCGHIGHGAILHGCRVGANALVGMHAVLMDGVEVGENAFVAALAFVKAGQVIPANSLFAGQPARLLRALSADELAWKSRGSAIYQELASRCLQTLEAVTPLSAEEPDRPRIRWAEQTSKPQPTFEALG
ncbi:phenylacetic acid degradation protein [Pseudomonas sp. SJZ079]|uniref:acyltransferase n=1 Tax=Pseudomonas sp. SJZ079 TaxID=2572887 RepID=UPI00119963A5|nr:transferase hexapeptide repeat family protein [Pseudomonas sp. SJZ079]TWC38596.1 phenylacetic acid degradation protein [Pseudomonas sp. SJZ079]